MKMVLEGVDWMNQGQNRVSGWAVVNIVINQVP
jgi:hypothetical protein